MGKRDDTDDVAAEWAETEDDEGFVTASVGTPQAELTRQVGRAAGTPREDPPTGDEGRTAGATPPKVTGQAETPAKEKAAREKPAKDTAAAEPKPDQSTPEGRKASLQAEINALTREKHQTKAEKEAAAAELAELRAELARAQAEVTAGKRKAPEHEAAAAPKVERKAEPVEDDFEDFRDWVKAHAAWTREQAKLDAEEILASREAAAEAARQTAETTRQSESFVAARRELATHHQARIATYQRAHPEFAPLMDKAAALPTNPAMDEHILHSEMGPALMHYLAEHPEECETIANLGFGPSLIALGKLEGRLEKEAAATAKSGSERRPAVSQAHPPVSPVGGTREIATDDDDGNPLDEEFSPEYVRKMNARDKTLSSV